MRNRIVCTGLLVAACVACGCNKPAAVEFKMTTINAQSPYEGVGVLDINRDGRLDIQCGAYWYEAPKWTKHPVRDIQAIDGYHMTFSDLPLDVDGDGWTDTICVAWHNKRVSWVRNPGAVGGTFEEIPIDTPGNIETAILADINGDGQQDAFPNIFNGEPGWYEFKRGDAKAPHGVKWTKHPLPKQMIGPGVGVGDIDGDGRTDVVGCKGWAEPPADKGGAWKWHAEFDLRDPGIPILVHDVDGDGDADLIWGIGHHYGLYWLEQEKDATGKRCWSQHQIDIAWSQAHVTLLADLDGDGQQELVTGKRYKAHDTDPGANDPRCIYWYKFDRAKRSWVRHAIMEGGPAGVGTSSALIDIDGDGDADFVTPGKSGLYLFENLRVR